MGKSAYRRWLHSPEHLKERNESGKSGFGELMSASFPRAFLERLKSEMEEKNDDEWKDKPNSRSEFIRNAVSYFLDEFGDFFEDMPDILEFKGGDDETCRKLRKNEVVTVSMSDDEKRGQERINKINSLLQKMNLVSNRSEFVRFIVLHYLLNRQKDADTSTEEPDLVGDRILYNGKACDVRQLKK